MVETPRYLGRLPHLAVGVRLPEVFLEGILTGFKIKNSVGGVMLSYHRETAPEYVIKAPPGVYEIARGHTGTSIRGYIESSVAKAREKGVVIEVEADHVSVSVSSEAVKRISGSTVQRRLSDKEVEAALKYIEEEVEEATSTRSINFYTIDTCDLIDYSVDALPVDDVDRAFKEVYGSPSLVEHYENIDVEMNGVRVRFDRERVKRLYLKFMRSLEVTEKIYEIIKEYTPWNFGVEVAFDETPSVTDPLELFFVLDRLRRMGITVDFIAPNVGFHKREDYLGDLESLYSRVKTYTLVSGIFGTLLSFHSGSGSSPYSMKGRGVHDTIRRATDGMFKYKVSGVYFELLMVLMSRHPSPRARRLYDEIYSAVTEFLEEQVRERGELYDQVLERRLEEHKKLFSSKGERVAEAPLFRYYSFLALNLRLDGRRVFRDAIIELYREDAEFRRDVDKEISTLTVKLLDSLGFSDNASFLDKYK